MVDIQNATLSGGVAVGAIADLMIQPYGAFLAGTFTGLVSCWGYRIAQPFLSRKFGLHDTCGVHNLHGLPGVLAGERTPWRRVAARPARTVPPGPLTDPEP